MKTHTVPELIKMLRRSRESITDLITSGKLPAFDVAAGSTNRQFRVTQESLDQFLEEHRVVHHG